MEAKDVAALEDAFLRGWTHFVGLEEAANLEDSSLDRRPRLG